MDSKYQKLIEDTLIEYEFKKNKKFKKDKPYTVDNFYKDKADQDKYDLEDREDEEDYGNIDQDRDFKYFDYKFNKSSFDKEEFYNQFVQSQDNKDIYQWLIKWDDEEGYYPESLYNELADSEFRIEIVDMQYIRVNGHEVRAYTVHKAKYDKLNWPIRIVKVPLDYNWEAIFQQSFLDDISYTSNKTALPVMLDKFSEVISEHYPTLLVTVNADFDVDDDYNGLYR